MTRLSDVQYLSIYNYNISRPPLFFFYLLLPNLDEHGRGNVVLFNFVWLRRGWEAEWHRSEIREFLLLLWEVMADERLQLPHRTTSCRVGPYNHHIRVDYRLLCPLFLRLLACLQRPTANGAHRRSTVTSTFFIPSPYSAVQLKLV